MFAVHGVPCLSNDDSSLDDPDLPASPKALPHDKSKKYKLSC
jgi:hypothetical protein